MPYNFKLFKNKILPISGLIVCQTLAMRWYKHHVNKTYGHLFEQHPKKTDGVFQNYQSYKIKSLDRPENKDINNTNYTPSYFQK